MQLIWSLVPLVASVATAAPSRLLPRAPKGAPTVALKNGSYYGVHNTQYNQDFFLGIPFAQPPIDDLRFTNPKTLNSTWEGALPATDYAFECIGYGLDQIGYQQSEDCLYLNVVRPAGYENASLPMAVWIHGGGFSEGGATDRRYNLSFIVDNSVKIGKPIMAASLAYRLGPFGFLNGDEIMSAGQTNIGLRDQRLALHWLNENAKDFGADPSKVTIFGESAGAASVGFHLTAYNGRDDGLFRGAMLESGAPVLYGALNSSSDFQPQYAALSKAAGCGNSTKTLDCLRKLPFTVLNNILNTTEFSNGWGPAMDGDFNARYQSEQLADGDFVHVPIVIGTNTDEGTSFGPYGINSSADVEAYIASRDYAAPGQADPVVKELTDLYTSGADDYLIPSSESLGGNVTLPSPYGAYYRASAAYGGDYAMHAGRRLTCETWAANNLSSYSFRFNAIPNGISWPAQVAHFQEVAFVFNNLEGLGYAISPFANKSESYVELSNFMSRAWANFVHDLDPNGFEGALANWPKYDNSQPQNIVFDANVTSYAEPDTWRAQGIKLINDNAEQFRR